MTDYSFSCVLLIPAQYKDAINAVAEALGYGPGCLSVELVHADTSIWYGCHTWATQAFLDQIANPPAEVALIPSGAEALAELVVSAVEGGDPIDNWSQALATNNLTRVEVTE